MNRIANATADIEDAGRALRILAKLVRGEYPPEYSLREIANIWGGNVSARDLDAISRLDRGELLLGSQDDRSDEG